MENTFKLNLNYPNPVSSSTQISYELPENYFVTLKGFNFQGRETNSLVNAYQKAGYHALNFNVSGVQDGVYFYEINAGQFIKTKKLIVMH